MTNEPVWRETYRGHPIQCVRVDGVEQIQAVLQNTEGPGETIAVCRSRTVAKRRVSCHVNRKTPRLDEIIRVAAWRVRDVTIEVDESMPTVAIGENVFLQGEEAEHFIDTAKELYGQAQTVTMDDCYACVAHPYAESCEA
jgi:hypothetical protein